MAHVNLRPIRTTDAETCFRWVNDPDVTRFLGLVQPPATLQRERAWIAGAIADKAQRRIFIIEDEQGRPIGTCGLRGIDHEAGTAFFGIMIGEKRLWNQGYGTAATKAIVDCGFRELDLKEIRLACHPDNPAGLRCYQKAGFRPSRHKPERERYGRGELHMALRRQDWEQLSEAAGE